VFFLEVFEAIKKRRSIRKYERKVVEKEKLLNVLEAARLSPSAMNRQPYAFVVTREKVTIERLSSASNQEWVAPIIIVVCAFPEEAWVRDDGEEYWKADAAVAMNNMSLLACAEGLGTCWIAAFEEEKVKAILGIKSEARVVAMTPLGYPAEKKGPVTKRKGLDELVHYERL
jgi:nitroreductase